MHGQPHIRLYIDCCFSCFVPSCIVLDIPPYSLYNEVLCFVCIVTHTLQFIQVVWLTNAVAIYSSPEPITDHRCCRFLSDYNIFKQHPFSISLLLWSAYSLSRTLWFGGITYLHTCTHIYIIHTYTYIHTYIHKHTYIYTCTHIYIIHTYTYKHTHTNIHTYIHAHIFT